MSQIAWIVLLVVAVVAVGAVAWWAGQRRRSDRLRERFGPEYGRAVESTGDRSRAERELETRQERVEAFDIRPLEPAARDRFRDRWRETQALFVDDPASAVGQADDLIAEVMRARGYPVGDFEQRAADVSVNHPEVVDHYRTAHRIAERQRRGEADTESLRQAMVHYRALFSDLLDIEGRDDGANGRADEPAGAPADEPATPNERSRR
ncbi:MAG TPA: hypothetical protein VFP19_07175 [Candidatus Limnocylindrales bacterium]|nr:hypothetical protein [Candidatus Limnocylindrales bacterium]